MLTVTAWPRAAVRRARWLAHGLWPRPLAEALSRRRTRNPQTFSEKVRYKMAHDRRPLLATLSDKWLVRDYIARSVGEHRLTTLYAVGSHARDVDWSGLPRNFAAKVTHASGGMVLVWEGADPDVSLPTSPVREWERFAVHPDSLDIDALQRQLDTWLSMTYRWAPGAYEEWAYQKLTPRLLVEELLVDSHGQLPRDIRFHVFHGQTHLIRVSQSTTVHDSAVFNSQLNVGAYFDVEWNVLPLKRSVGGLLDKQFEPSLPRPDELDEMLTIAHAVASETDFARVDMFNVDGRIVMGEITHYPDMGVNLIVPETFDRELGSHWQVPTHYSRYQPRSVAVSASGNW